MPNQFTIPPVDDVEGMRTCTECGAVKPLDDFHRDRSGPAGRRRQCKPCRVSAASKWYFANHERQRERANARRANEGERLRAEDRERYYRDKDKRISLVEDSAHQRRAMRAGVPAVKGITRDSLRERHGDRCCYCGITMDFGRGTHDYEDRKASIEHVIALSAGGAHDWDNVRLACLGCNTGKNRGRTAEEWLAILGDRSVDT